MARYSREFKAQIVKEIKEVGSTVAVCKKHGLDNRSVWHWVNATKKDSSKKEVVATKELNKKIHEQTIEIKVLKELLKKTYQVWNAEEK